MRHNLTILSIAALSLFFSCNKMETIQNPDGSITVTASVSMAQTKALTPIGEKTFAINDQLAVIYKKDNGSTAVAISEKLTSSDIQRSGKYAKFRVTFTDPDKTQSVTYVYPANMAKNDGDINNDALYSGQDGTLSKIASSFDLCTKVVSWSGSSLPEGQTLVNQLTVAQFTFRDGAIDGDSGNITSSLTGLTVTNGSDEYSVTLSSNSTVWVAMKPITTGDIEFEATDGSNNYTKTVTGQTMSMGTLYSNITVSMNKVPSIPTGALSGKFTINGSGNQVRFSKGNLQYTKSTSTWSFMEQQYSTVETNASPYCTDDYGDKDVVSLFGWATSGYNHGATCYQPYSTNTTCSRYYAYGNSSKNLYDQTGQADWGYNAISNGGNTENSGWRTLTRDEWVYLFNTRTTGGTVFGTSSARYAHATIRTDVSGGVNGMILFPDGLSIAASEVTTAGTVNDNSAWGTKCTSTQWTALAAKGCVFLPAAGERFGDNDGVTVRLVGSNGCYWASTYYTTDNGGHVAFGNNFLSPYGGLRRSGHSVRLVRDVE